VHRHLGRRLLALGVLVTIAVVVTVVLVGRSPSPANPCVAGYRERLITAGDHVCISDALFDQVQVDNAAGDRVDPNGAYGPRSCKYPYVWREAVADDDVCVTPDNRAAHAAANAQSTQHER
jgi:hypothetical protein